MLAHEEEKCFFLHKHFLLCSNDKDIPTLNCLHTALSLESARIVSRNKVHKTQKVAVAFETLFLLAKRNGYPTFHGRPF